MKKQLYFSLTMMLLILAISGCSTKEQTKEVAEEQVELTVSAAASLKDSLNELKENFEKEYTHIKINFNFGSSGALQQQISQGAPVDIFFSAAEDKFDQLMKEGFIEKDNVIDLLGNELVLIIPNDATKAINTFEDLSKVDKISIGTPESVPAGKYAKESLEKMNVWKAVEGKIVYAKDVRQVLTYVETNNVDAGIVYKTDAMISSKVKIVATAEDDTHAPIIYPLGIIKDNSHPKETHLLYDYLQNDQSIEILEKYGFKGLK